MTHTIFYGDNTLVVPNRVAAYDPGPESNFLVDWSTTYDNVGGGGLMSSVDDLLAWDRNFYVNQLGKGTLGSARSPGVTACLAARTPSTGGGRTRTEPILTSHLQQELSLPVSNQDE